MCINFGHFLWYFFLSFFRCCRFFILCWILSFRSCLQMIVLALFKLVNILSPLYLSELKIIKWFPFFPVHDKVSSLHLCIHKSIPEKQLFNIWVPRMVDRIALQVLLAFTNKQILPSVGPLWVCASSSTLPLRQLLKETSANFQVWPARVHILKGLHQCPPEFHHEVDRQDTAGTWLAPHWVHEDSTRVVSCLVYEVVDFFRYLVVVIKN